MNVVRAAKSGDETAREHLVRANWRRAWRSALAVTGCPATAEDVAQESLTRAFSELRRFDGRESFGSWLSRIATNRAIDVVRAEMRRDNRERLYARPEAVYQLGPEHDPELEMAVRKLDVEQRLVVVLRFWLDYTLPQIAEAIGVREGTAKSRLARAMEQLRESIGDDDGR